MLFQAIASRGAPRIEVLKLGPLLFRINKVSKPFGFGGTLPANFFAHTQATSVISKVGLTPLNSSRIDDNLRVPGHLITLKKVSKVRTVLIALESPASIRRRSGPGIIRGNPRLDDTLILPVWGQVVGEPAI
jgi:hypothetical protein